MERATTYSDLKDSIIRGFPAMSNQLQRIARFALDKPHDMALGTVAAVAEATAVQPSAMIRFANALGYNGFSEMQQVFRSHLVERSASYRERIAEMRQSAGGAATRDSVLQQLVGEAMGELGHLEEHVPASRFSAAVKMIAKASQIYVLAQRRAYPVACYIAYALNQLELRTHLLDGAGGMLDAHLKMIAASDLLIVASFRNYSPQVIAAADACHMRGVPVLAITDGPLSPLKSVARVSFDVSDASAQPFRSLVAPMCLAQALVVSAGHHLTESSPNARGLRHPTTRKRAA